MRIGELLALSKEDVDFENNQINIDQRIIIGSKIMNGIWRINKRSGNWKR